MNQRDKNFLRIKDSHLTLVDYETDLKKVLGYELGLSKRQAEDILLGSEDIVSSAWWNNVSLDEIAKKIRDKELIGF